jgi:hypothetical protein
MSVMASGRGTNNVEHFTRMDDLPYEIYSVDEFFELIDDSAPQIVRAVTAEQLVYYVRRSDTSLVSLPERLKAAGAPAFAERVRQHLRTLDINALLREPT